MTLKFKQSTDRNSWARMRVEESAHSLRVQGKKRKHTFRRMYLSVFVWFSAASLLYASLFYVGAFLDVGKVIGVSQSQRAVKAKAGVNKIQPMQKRHILSPVSDALAINRVYLRKGQAIQALYSLPEGTQMKMKIKQCQSLPVLEVFKCKFVGEQEKRINNGTKGAMKFTATQSGFYYFEDEVIRIPGAKLKLNYDYKIIWQRS